MRLPRSSAVPGLLLVASAGCDAPVDPMAAWRVGDGPPATVTGKAFVFGPSGGRTLDGAVVSVAEAPEIAAPLAADGTFALEVPSGRPISLQVRLDGFHATQTAALELTEAGLDMVGFQVPTDERSRPRRGRSTSST